MDPVKPTRQLCRQSVKILERLQLADGAYVPLWTVVDYLYGDSKNIPSSADSVVRQAVYRTRKAFPPGTIESVQGQGYRLTRPVVLPKIDKRSREELVDAQ